LSASSIIVEPSSPPLQCSPAWAGQATSTPSLATAVIATCVGPRIAKPTAWQQFVFDNNAIPLKPLLTGNAQGFATLRLQQFRTNFAVTC
jgi:hypothetical protein